MSAQKPSKPSCARKALLFSSFLSHLHRTNAAERAIQTFKNQFVVGLSSCDPDFPLHIWYCLLPQARLTLNLLHPYRINPCLSAKAQLNGDFDFIKTPLAPPSTKALIFEPFTTRLTWAHHGIQVWYLGTVPEHY